jgi:hypothetical protein
MQKLILSILILFSFQGCFFAKWYENERFSAFKEGAHRSEIISNIGVPTKSYKFEEGENGDLKTVDVFYFREVKDSELQINFADVTPNGIFTVRQPKMEFNYVKVTYDGEDIAQEVEFSGDEDEE